MIDNLKELMTTSQTDVYECFDRMGLDCGPQDGGCRAYAAALMNILSAYFDGLEAKLAFCGRRNVYDHVVLHLSLEGEVYLADSDGVYSVDEMRAKVARDIHAMSKVDLLPYSECEADAVGILDYSEIGLVPALQRVLEKHALRVCSTADLAPGF